MKYYSTVKIQNSDIVSNMDRNGIHCLGKQVGRHCKANNTDPHPILEIGSWPQKKKRMR